jgi:tRNA dimethylallyltransferase
MAAPVLILAGPTASGKSRLALGLAERYAGVVINADSMQVYRELRVLTARPGPEAIAKAPHRLYGILPAAEACSAGRWREMALAGIAAAHKGGMLPIMVGGTGLYLKALVDGLVELPPVPLSVRAEARTLYDRLGPAGFHAALAARDSATARHLAPADRQRLVRAWEVLESTGRPLAEWQAAATAGPPAHLRFAAILLAPPRAELYTACNRRFDAMMSEGALAEVETLLALALDPHLPAMKAVGVAELARHLRCELPLTGAVALAQQATRRLAKRQLTWFRHQRLTPEVFVAKEPLGAQFSESFKERIFNFIDGFLLTGGAARV